MTVDTATLGEPPEMKKFNGPQRAAALMLALGKEHGGPIWEHLSTEEIKELSAAIAQLGRIPAAVAEYLLVHFTGEVASMASLHGSYESTERLLIGMMPDDRVREIMEDIRGPSGRTMWDKLSNVNETVLAAYLRNEYPQTVAVILSRLKPEHAARVISELPGTMSVDVIQRMLRMDNVQKEIITQIEDTLKHEFMSNLSRTQKRDPHESMADIFNAMDRQTEETMLTALEAKIPDSADRIRQLMFTFEDLANLLPASVAVVVRQADKRIMALALKAAPENIKEVFFGALTDRAAKLLRDEMESMGPVRARECDEAQSELIRLAKNLADRGEIVLVDPKSDDAMVY
ncbi:flagellar motor switch protein FliG [Sphingorhabdus sp. M41]|uniref:flagellar motor switch protein FliG n=1 Tax=Sphingorhabdus sp. M41 TaxID=1806885 RepID=UPI00078BF2D0|nr:flagellar motor switch protein FliG [Sphingorhabdus sp. M41]AMO72610.1 flagellar motor switch protein FliG [Sphingorhabdus sp. M41]